jgi:RIMS-binding protein 2
VSLLIPYFLQVTKERLQLERHLQIANDSLQKNNGIDLHRYLSLEQSNSHLRQQLTSLDLLQQEHRLVAIQYREKEEACRELQNSLNYKSAQCDDLESQLARVLEKNNFLEAANNDLQRKVGELKNVTDECESLKSTLTQVSSECEGAKTEVRSLFGKVRNLEQVLDEMNRAAESRREIERQHKEAMESLKRRQDEVEETATKKQAELINSLKDKIAGLERERKFQNEKHTDLILEMAEIKKYGKAESISSDIEQPSDNLEIDQIMAKLEQDNKFLEDLEKQRAAAEKKGESPSPPAASSGGLHRTNSAITDSGFLSQSSLNGSSTSPTASKVNNGSSGSLNKLPGLTGAEKVNLLNSGSSYGSGLRNGKHQNNNQRYGGSVSPSSCIDKVDNIIDMPGKGWCFVYIARYSYDPFQHSPNETPEAELQVNAGDYILVWGELDEDGFYDGELLDGRRGLVPSNFVEKLEGDDLVDFHQQVVLGVGDCDDSVCTSIPQDLDFLSSDELDETTVKTTTKSGSAYFSARKTVTNLLPQYASCTDLELSEEDENGGGGNSGDGGGSSSNGGKVPAPKQLTLEALQNKSLVIGWNPPTDYSSNKIESYHVIVDGNVQATVEPTAENGSKQLRATVQGFNASVIHRVSVKTVGTNGRNSNEAACTMVFGKDAPLSPTMVKATKTTSTSSTLAWIPSNTNFMHAICVNNVEVKTVKPGVYRHSLAGLQPNTNYKVSIRAKNLKAASAHVAGHNLQQLQNLSSSIEIRTQPQGLPEPPVDVQVDVRDNGQQIVVSWLPVTINPSGTSNGSPVTGYVIYADGKGIKDIDSGTADQAIVDISNRMSVKSITVRTKSRDKLSKDSDPCMINVRRSSDEDSESEGELIERLAPGTAGTNLSRGANGNGLAKPREMLLNYSGYPELDSDIGPSELSDIAEEPEEGLTDNEEGRDSETPSNDARTPAYDRSSLYKSNSNALSEWNSKMETPAKPTASASSTTATTVSSGITTTNISSAASNFGPLGSSQFHAQPLTTVTPINANSSTSESNKSQPKKNDSGSNHIYRATAVHITHNDLSSAGMTSSPAVSASSGGAVKKSVVSVTANGVNGSSTDIMSQVVQQQSAPAPQPPHQRIRIFVALFDYEPATMSPNPESSDEELPFREGQLIKIVGEKDSDGFYWGEAGNRTGYVPCNMVSEVQVDDEHVAEELFREQQQHKTSAASSTATSGSVTVKQQNSAAIDDDRWGDIYEDMPARRKLALYDYDPQELSPNVDAEVELSFRTGDLLLVYGEMDDDGFYMGELNGRRGLVPSNFLTDVPPGYDPKHLMKLMAAAASVTAGGAARPQQQPRVLGQHRRW